ncbi:MAG: hypothetical protein AAF598_07265 [Bacteroidota bacterium]
MENRIGSILTYIAGLGVLVFGFVYLLKPSYMPYHAEAVGTSWSEVPPAFQRLFLTYMKAASGGWIALGLVFIYLQFRFNTSKAIWIPYVILIGGLLFAAISLYSAIGLKVTTPANPPLVPMFLIIGIMLTGFYFNWSFGRKVQT